MIKPQKSCALTNPERIMAGKIPPPPPPRLASLFRRGGKAENPLFPRLCQVETVPRPPRSPSVPTLLIPNSVPVGWDQPGGPGPPVQPCWRGAAPGCVSLMLGHCWAGRLLLELLLPNPTSGPLPQPQTCTRRAAPLPEQFGSWPPGKEVSLLVGSLRRVTAVIP